MAAPEPSLTGAGATPQGPHAASAPGPPDAGTATGATPPWEHDHSFGQEEPKAGERRTLVVVAITFVTMAVEIVAGVAFGSMALLADGLHMASHGVALGIAAFAYGWARRHAHDRRYTFGTGKVNALAGFTGGVLLVGFALYMVVESVGRFLHPVAIVFDRAIAVAVVGLVVNGVCAWILGTAHDHGHGHGHEHGHEHERTRTHAQEDDRAHAHADEHAHEHNHEEEHAQAHGHGGTHEPDLAAPPTAGAEHHDHNLRSAYLHVLADALTSLLAIGALLAGKYLGASWMDPAMGLVGAALVTRWSAGLLRTTSGVLLDRQAPEPLCRDLVERIERAGDARVTDLHVWSIGPGVLAAEIAVVSPSPLDASAYKTRVADVPRLAHVTVEVHAADATD